MKAPPSKSKPETGKNGSSIIWPSVASKPLLKSNLLKSSDLFTVPDFLTLGEAEAFIRQAEALGFLHQGSLGPSKGEAFRDNGRLALHDAGLAENLWKAGLCNLFSHISLQGKRAVGFNPNIRFYRYTQGQRFGQHIDESVILDGKKRTEYTLLIYLSGGKNMRRKMGDCFPGSASEVLGGETVFYDHRGCVLAEVQPLAGMALFHRHGNQCLLHEARAVSQGIKYILRSDVVFA